MTDTRLRDVVSTEIEQLERYGEAAEEFFHQLTGEIREEFSASLDEMLNSEMTHFQSRLQSAYQGGYDIAGTLGNTAGNIFGDFLTGPDLFSQVFGLAVNNAVRTAVRDFVRTGTVDLKRVITAADRGGTTVFNQAARTEMNLSSSQQNADVLLALSRSQRNS